MATPSWTRDRVFWTAVLTGTLLRALPLLLWGWNGTDTPCIRDECIYRHVTEPMLRGRSMALAPAGWLPAPGYPYLLALTATVFGAIEAVRWVQVALTPVTLALYTDVSERLGGRAAGRWTAWLLALHPTLVYFAGRMWTETVYVTCLGAIAWGVLWSRDGSPRRAIVPGVALGLTVLTRGVATYLLPIVLLALLWSDRGGTWRDALRARARHLLVFVASALLVVLPYSVSASMRFGGVVVSDATLGHVAKLGNDDFPPVTFDYGNGQLTGKMYRRTLRAGRPDCPRERDPLAHNRCEIAHAVAWVQANPGTFLARVPERQAQLFNPHSFLTRHLRWHAWRGLPWELEELLVLLQAASSLVILLGGTVAAWARARGPYGVFAVGAVVYHVAVISVLYGLTRFRLPLEPLWLVFLACALAEPRHTLAQLRGLRLVGAVVTVPALAWLASRYLWTGWPGFEVAL